MSNNLFLGNRLHKRRNELQLTLRDLAEKTNLTPSFLSQLERGLANPSLSSLQRLSDALGVPLLYFIEGQPSQSPVVRAGSRSKLDLDDDRVSYELLTPDLTGSVEVLLGKMQSDCQNIVRKLSVETEETIFVLEGTLLVGLSENEYVLNAGDSIRFAGSELVKLCCSDGQLTRWISIITPPVF